MPGAENAARTSRLRPIFFTTRLRVRIPNPKICRRRAHSSPTAPSIAGTRSGRRHHRDSKSARSRRNPGQSDARPVDRAVARAERTNNAKHRGNSKQRDGPMTQMLSPKEQSELNDRLTGADSDGDAATVQTLLAHGADVHALDDWALRWAVNNGHTETVHVLLAADADVHADNDWALCFSASGGHREIVQALLAAGANVHASDDYALRLAASNGHTVTVKTLLAHGADVHARDDEALCWAACNGHTETVKVLQEAIKSHNTQRLELERRQNPLYAGTGLIFAKSRPEDVEVLLRDAIAEQSSGVSAVAMLAQPGGVSAVAVLAQPGGVSVLTPLASASATGAQAERPDGREHIPLPLCP